MPHLVTSTSEANKLVCTRCLTKLLTYETVRTDGSGTVHKDRRKDKMQSEVTTCLTTYSVYVGGRQFGQNMQRYRAPRDRKRVMRVGNCSVARPTVVHGFLNKHPAQCKHWLVVAADRMYSTHNTVQQRMSWNKIFAMTHTHTQTHTQHTHIHTHTHANKHTHITHTNKHTYTHMHTHTNKHTHTQAHTRKHTQTHTQTEK